VLLQEPGFTVILKINYHIKTTIFRFLMNFKLIAKSLLIGFVHLQSIYSQEHTNAWLRSTLRLTLYHDKVYLDNEFQHRRQNGFGNNNPLDKSLLNSYRIWIHYQFNKNNKLSISPFSYFSSHPLIVEQKDEQANIRSEKRFALAYLWTPNLTTKVKFIARTAIELRIFNNNFLFRTRYRFGLTYQPFEKMRFVFYGESFLHCPSGFENNIFDQLRTVAMLECKISKSLKVELGFMPAFRQSTFYESKWYERNILAYLTYTIP
jgi:hypothetical protein